MSRRFKFKIRGRRIFVEEKYEEVDPPRRNRTILKSQGLFETQVGDRTYRFQVPPDLHHTKRVQKRTPKIRTRRDAFELAKLKAWWWHQFTYDKDAPKKAKPPGNKAVRAGERAKAKNKNGKPRNRPYLPKPGRRQKNTFRARRFR